MTDGGCTLVGTDRATAGNAFADCTVTATQPGDARYAAAPPVKAAFRIDPIPSSISLGNARKQGGGSGSGTWDVTVTITFKSAREVLASVRVDPTDACSGSGSADVTRSGKQTFTIEVTTTPCDLVATFQSAQVSPATSAAVTIR